MARSSATNAVAAGVMAALNVASLRVLAPGGVYRGRPPAQLPPYVMIGHCGEESWSSIGTHYGAEVRVPVVAVISGQDANGCERAGTIIDHVINLLELRTSITVEGWDVADVWYRRCDESDDNTMDGLVGYARTAIFDVQVRKS